MTTRRAPRRDEDPMLRKVRRRLLGEVQPIHDRVAELGDITRRLETRQTRLKDQLQNAARRLTAASRERAALKTAVEELGGNPSDDSGALRRSMARAKLAKPDLTPAGRVRLLEQALQLGAVTPEEADEYRAEHNLPPRP